MQGVFSMCRYHQLWGGIAAAFGAGILLGTWLEGGFLCTVFGIGLILAGAYLFKKPMA